MDACKPLRERESGAKLQGDQHGQKQTEKAENGEKGRKGRERPRIDEFSGETTDGNGQCNMCNAAPGAAPEVDVGRSRVD